MPNILKALLHFIFIAGTLFSKVSLARAENCWSQSPQLDPQMAKIFRGAQLALGSLNCLIQNENDKAAFRLWLQLIGLDTYHDAEQFENKLPGLDSYLQAKIEKDPNLRTLLYQLKSEFEASERKIESRDYVAIDEVAGQGRFKDFASGSLWDRLLELTHHDSEKALLIMAIANNTTPLAYIDADTPSGRFYFGLTQTINTIPRILSARLDIPDKLKQEIMHVNERDGGLKTVNAKAYHFHLAAFMSCELLKTGASPLFVSKLQKFTAFSYRLAWLNAEYESLNLKIKNKQELTESEKVSVDAFKMINFLNFHQNEENSFYFLNGSSSNLALFLNPFAEISPEYTEALLDLKTKLGWITPRFDKAQRRLLVWKTDKKWTIAQHSAGFEFAKNVCL